MIREKPITHEVLMKAIMSKKIVIQQSTALHPRRESDYERVQRQILLHYLGY